MDERNAFLVGMTDDQISKISAATNIPPDVVADGIAFENRWTDKGMPGEEQAMMARTALVQAVVALVYGMGAAPQLVADYVLDVIAETQILADKHGPAAAPGEQPVGDEGPEDDEEDGEEDEDDGEENATK